MGRKRAPMGEHLVVHPPPRPARRGRPPLPPKTTLGHWLANHDTTVVSFCRRLAEIAPLVGLREDDAPATKTMLDAINARYWPSPKTMLMVERATNGDVSLAHWVRDLSRILS